MGNISWRSQVSLEDTDSSLHDEDTGKDNSTVRVCIVEKIVFLSEHGSVFISFFKKEKL